MKSISIAMATYNGARFIGEQLGSLAYQTMLPAELVITDDDSTDNTLDIVKAFAAKAPFPVRIVKNSTRLGYRDNFMKAAGLCQSDLIAFSDQDDVWKPNKLETCLRAFSNRDVSLAYHNATIVTETLEPLGSMDFSGAQQSISPPLSLEPWKNAAWGFTVVIDRFLLEFHDLWQQSVDVYEHDKKDKHDQWFFFLASCLGSIAYIGDSLALYRQHGQNAVGYSGAPTIRGKLSILIANDLDGIQAREISATHRASILEKAQKQLDHHYGTRAKKAAAGYRKLESIYRLRREIYLSSGLLPKSLQILTLFRSGGYRPRNQWGVGWQALLRDIARGILFPRRNPRHLGRTRKTTAKAHR